MAKNNTKFSGKQFDFVLFIVIILLLSLGIVMVLSASAPSALAKYGNSYEYVTTQGISALARHFVNVSYI